jgi:hypothetical protein
MKAPIAVIAFPVEKGERIEFHIREERPGGGTKGVYMSSVTIAEAKQIIVELREAVALARKYPQ